MDEQITRSCGNVYADLGLPDAEEMQFKSKLASTIQGIMEARGLTQTKAAEIIGIPQPKLSDILRGKFRGVSEAKMMECITRLGRDIRIVINAHERPANNPGHIEVCIGA
ncbi:MAG: helix-turn-helix domain-containing protein [Desulfovibrio sp.]|jgi:predicted XRE-type DNA-binding protein|nr:helix-turn-helix domain-containing protein [Desulfovibrio sp.]